MLPGRHQQSQRDQIAEVGDPAGQAGGAKPYRTHREREHCRHPHGIDRNKGLGVAATKREEVAIGIRGEHRHQAARGNCADEEHRQEEQPATEKDCGEQTILHIAELFTDHADKPQKGNSGKRHQVEAQPDEAAPLRIRLQRLKAVLRQGKTHHRHG
jgi:hypothetical protein